MKKSIYIFFFLVILHSTRQEEVRLLDLEPQDAKQIIDQQDTSLKYAPKVESNVPAVRYIGNEPQNVVEDIYLANQYHGQDGLGGYLYGYSVPDIAKTEKKQAGGDLRGAYNYIAGNGQEIKVEYWDDGTGFHQVDNVPKNLPEDLPEVKKAKEDFLRIWQEQAERNSRPVEDPYNSEGQYKEGPLSVQGQLHRQQQFTAQFGQQQGGYQGTSSQQGGYQAGSQGGYQPGPAQGGYQAGPAQGGYQAGASQSGYQAGASQGSYQAGASQGGYQAGSSQQGGYQAAAASQQHSIYQSNLEKAPQTYNPNYQPYQGKDQQNQGTYQSKQYNPQTSPQGNTGYGQGAPGAKGQGYGSPGYGQQTQSSGSSGYGQSANQGYGQGNPAHQGQGSGAPGYGQGNPSQGKGSQGAQGYGGYGQGNPAQKSPQGGYHQTQYQGQPSDNVNQYTQNPQSSYARQNPGGQNQNNYGGQQGQEDDGQYHEKDEEQQGPPKGFFYKFDYPVGIIVSKQGPAQGKSFDQQGGGYQPHQNKQPGTY